MEILDELVIVFILSIAINIICSKFRLPATVGFLISGVICGPSMLGVISDNHSIEEIADIGVAMLMFTIGMELSGDALNRLKRPVFLGGSLQIGIVILCAWAIGLFKGFPAAGVLWGCLIALSSSAIVLQLFAAKGITATPVGRLTLAILVFQDIMVAPMMLLVPLLAGTLELTWTSCLVSLVKLGGLAAGLYLLARYALDRIVNAIVHTNSREVLLLSVLSACLGCALLTTSLGMSLSLGAFLAGLMLARSEYSMSVIADILPYRDVFMSIFFISVGMMLDIRFVLSNAVSIIGLVGVFIVVKTILGVPAVLMQGYPLKTSIRTSLCLAQVGEFAFVLAASGVDNGLLSENARQWFLSISVVTMMLTPTLINYAPRITEVVCKVLGRLGLRSALRDTDERIESEELSDHVIIIGFGFSGKSLAASCKESGIAYNILEMNPETVAHYRKREPIFYGDASQPSILTHLGIAKARVLAIVISDPSAVRAIVTQARVLNPNVTIIARTRFVTEIGSLQQMGANYVVAEEFESAVEVFSQVLSGYLIPRQDIEKIAEKVRLKNHRRIRRLARTSGDISSAAAQLPDMGVQTLRLESASAYVGKTLVQSNIRKSYGVTIVAVARGESVLSSPAADFCMQAGDILYVFGKTSALYAIRPVISGTEPPKDGCQMAV